jgi:hypothetical protein
VSSIAQPVPLITPNVSPSIPTPLLRFGRTGIRKPEEVTHLSAQVSNRFVLNGGAKVLLFHQTTKFLPHFFHFLRIFFEKKPKNDQKCTFFEKKLRKRLHVSKKSINFAASFGFNLTRRTHLIYNVHV